MRQRATNISRPSFVRIHQFPFAISDRAVHLLKHVENVEGDKAKASEIRV